MMVATATTHMLMLWVDVSTSEWDFITTIVSSFETTWHHTSILTSLILLVTIHDLLTILIHLHIGLVVETLSRLRKAMSTFMRC